MSGKSINVIRPFPGIGTLVWGARTLDGNSQDWRYINVRRTTTTILKNYTEFLKGRWGHRPRRKIYIILELRFTFDDLGIVIIPKLFRNDSVTRSIDVETITLLFSSLILSITMPTNFL